jgi:drug/metabolite transporter (DMT)-like permease
VGSRIQRQWKKNEAVLGLAYVALIWGTTFPLIRMAMSYVDADLFVALRFTLAAIVLSFILAIRGQFRNFPVKDFSISVGIGFVVAVVYLSQTIGLKTVTSPRAAFLTGANILFVPLCSRLLGHRPHRLEILSALVAFIGLFFLADPFSGGLGSYGMSAGDLWILLCAVFLAIQLHLVKAVSERGASPAILAFGQILGVTLFSWGICLASASHHTVNWTWNLVAILIFCSVGVSLAAFYLHSRYQRSVSAEKASVIFGLEPVSAAFFGFFFLGETLSNRGFLGAGLMLLALMVPMLIPRMRRFAPSKLMHPEPLRSISNRSC